MVRVTGQNSLDHPGTGVTGPIIMTFEIARMATAAIPGIDGLRSHLKAVAEQTRNQEGNDRMVRAAELASADEIDVLRISDENTTGLTGDETLAESSSPLSRLTRGRDGSRTDDRGGSFGIGSAVGPMASDLATVLNTSLPEDGNQLVLAGCTRLATHRIGGHRLRAEGYFTRLGVDDFDYLRPAGHHRRPP